MNANFAQFPASAAAFYRYSAAFMTQSFGLREKQRCCYPSKRCQNPRVLKRNGELHRLCEYHRMKANVNQRRLEQRRRQRNSSVSSQDAGHAEHERELEKNPVFANTAPVQLHKRERFVQTNVVAKASRPQPSSPPQHQQQPQRQRIQLNVQPRPQYKAEDRDRPRSQRFSLPNLSSTDLPSPSLNDLNEADMHFLDEFLSETDIDLPPLTAEEAELGEMASTFRFLDASSDTRMSI